MINRSALIDTDAFACPVTMSFRCGLTDPKGEMDRWDAPTVQPAPGECAGGGLPRQRHDLTPIQICLSRGRRRRVRPGLVLALAGVCGVGFLWIAVTATMARGELERLRSGTAQLRTQLAAADVATANATADSLSRHAQRAHRLTGGPAWWIGQRVPVLGAPLRTVRGITAAADEVSTSALPQLVAVGERIDPASLRASDGRIDVDALRAAAPALDKAATSITRAADIADDLPRSTWLSAVDHARVEISSALSGLDHVVGRTRMAATVLPAMLGADGPRRYFVAFQNDAEARGTGGLPGAFAILRAENGRLTFERFEEDGALRGVSVTPDLPAEFERLYGPSPMNLFLNSNLSPHFPYAAGIWAAMWQKKTGERIDGALAFDPTALSYLLAVTGPATLPGGGRISAANVVSETQNALYLRYADDVVGRKRHLLAVARTVADRIVGFDGDPTGLLRGLSKAVGERRLLVWSADPVVQGELVSTPMAGVVPETSAPYVGLTVINSGGNKLDYYLDRSLQWERTGCGSRRAVRATIRLTNAVPADLTGDYITHRSDARTYPTRPGDNRVAIFYTATRGARLTSLLIDGRPTRFVAGTERGHPVFVVDVELPRRVTRTIELGLVEPGTAGPPVLQRQPLVRPLEATVRDADCPARPST